MAVIAAITLSLVDEAIATCPNACSGHGTCGDYDSCSCYSNFQGADCSLRTCPHHFAWATTSKGDLNFDGDVNDATVYETTTKFANSGVEYVATQANAGGDWEGWPSTFNGINVDEGHFYMECANRGTCDRKLGTCKCFEGYTGASCQRTTCPEKCNGRGTCKSVNEQGSAAGFTYGLWDGDMSHSCVCDKGFSGPSCADRSCPVGDDPMTMDQQFETQWVEITSPYVTSEDKPFSGQIRVTYTDKNGETYETDKITVAPYEGSDTTTTAAFASALNGLPNNQLSGVTVEEGWCQTAIPGTFDLTATNLVFAVSGNSAATFDPSSATLPTRCDFATSGYADFKLLPVDLTTGGILKADGTAHTGLTTETDKICYRLTDYYCNRYKVTFATTPGDHAALTVDTANMIVDSQTVSAGATASYSVVDTLLLGTDDGTGGIVVGFKGLGQASTMSSSCSTCVITGQVVDFSNQAGEGVKYEEGERMSVTCNGVAWGTFTVVSVATDAITVLETIRACGSGQGLAAALASYVITTNTYLEGMLSVGDRLIVDNFASVPPTIAAFKWDATAASNPGRLILSGAYVGGDGVNGDENDSGVGADKVKQYGTGTTENSECSDRGVCNSETGACKCFKGYTGRSCSTQNALSG